MNYKVIRLTGSIIQGLRTCFSVKERGWYWKGNHSTVYGANISLQDLLNLDKNVTRNLTESLSALKSSHITIGNA
jgi:hypothetical protein